MIFNEILTKTPTLPTELNPAIPERLAHVIEKCLEKDRDLRCQTAPELRADLKRLARGSGSGDGVARSGPRIGHPRWSALLWVTPLLLVLVAALGWMLRDSSPPPPPEIRPLTSLEGFELNPALSPNGEQVAYDYSPHADGPRHIYVKSIATGTTLQLTEGDVTDHGPSWSPDGQEVAFVRDTPRGHDVLVVPALGGPVRRLAETTVADRPEDKLEVGVAHSPGRDLLAFLDRDPDELQPSVFLLSRATGQKRQLTFPKARREGRVFDRTPSFSPDGGTIAFVRTLLGSGGMSFLCVQTLEETEPTMLTSDRSSPVFDIEWTRDGRALLFSRQTTFGQSQLLRMSIDGGQEESLGMFAGARSLSVGDGDRLVYSRWIQDFNIWLASGPASAESLPPQRIIASTRHDVNPHLSADGSKIAFVSDRNGTPEIFVANSDGTDPRQLTDMGHAIFPNFSPEGRLIAFSSIAHPTSAPLSDVYIVDVDGGYPRNLTDDSIGDALGSWSNDGQWLFFQSKRAGDVWQVWKKPIDGGEPVRLTTSDGLRPQQAGDGRVYYSSLDGRVWSVSDEGGDERLVLDAPVPFAGWAARGRYLAFVDLESQSVKALNVLTDELTELTWLPTQLSLSETRVSLSADGRQILYAQPDQAGADLMLVENFR